MRARNAERYSVIVGIVQMDFGLVRSTAVSKIMAECASNALSRGLKVHPVSGMEIKLIVQPQWLYLVYEPQHLLPVGVTGQGRLGVCAPFRPAFLSRISGFCESVRKG